jgi:hypothetical protein
MIQEILSKKYNLEALVDPFVYSKMKNRNTDEFSSIIKHINSAENICVKVSSTDFLDSRNRRVLDYYKDIDYKSFDKIIFVTRDDIITASLSFAHMTMGAPNTWHSTKDRQLSGKTFSPDIDRILYLLRSYRVFEFIKNYITTNGINEIYDYEYDTVEHNLKNDFDLNDTDFDINLIANDINYSQLIDNYNSVSDFIKSVYSIISRTIDDDLNQFYSKFWMRSI